MALTFLPPLPPFGGGGAFFAAQAARERDSRGRLLPVPPGLASIQLQLLQHSADDRQAEGWWLQAAAQASELGCSGEPMLAPVLRAMPRSKAERAINKRAFAAMCRQVQPGVLLAEPGCPQQQQQHSLQDAVCQQYAAFSSAPAGAAPCAAAAARPSSRALPVLDEPVLQAGSSSYDRSTAPPDKDDWLSDGGGLFVPSPLPGDADVASDQHALELAGPKVQALPETTPSQPPPDSAMQLVLRHAAGLPAPACWPERVLVQEEAALASTWVHPAAGTADFFAFLRRHAMTEMETDHDAAAAGASSGDAAVLASSSPSSTGQLRIRLPDSLLPRQLATPQASDAVHQQPESLGAVLTRFLQAAGGHSAQAPNRAAPPEEALVPQLCVEAGAGGGAAAVSATVQPPAQATSSQPVDEAVQPDGAAEGAAQQQAVAAAGSPQSRPAAGGLQVEVPIWQPNTKTDGFGEHLTTQAMQLVQAVLQQQQQPSQAWDGSWGELRAPSTTGADCAGGGSSTPWWRGHAVAGMLSSAKAQAATEAAAGSSVPPLGPSEALEQMLAADMQLDEADTNVLPVPLFSDEAAMSCGFEGDDSVAQLLAACPYQHQPTGHLELYFDWSMLQPPQHQLAFVGAGRAGHSSTSGKRAREALLAQDGPGSSKRRKAACSILVRQQAPGDVLAWLLAVSHCPGLQQLREPLQAHPDGNGARMTVGVAASSLSCQVASTLMMPQPPAASSRCAPEVAPPAVAVAAAAWSKAAAAAAHQQLAAPQSRQPQSAAGAVSDAAATPAQTAAPASDLDFFLHMRGLTQQRQQHGRKRSSTAITGLGGAHDAGSGDPATTDPTASKHPKLAAAAPAGAPAADAAAPNAPAATHGASAQTRQQHACQATAAFALNGAAVDAEVQHLAAAREPEAPPPAQVIAVPVSDSIARLLAVLHTSRHALLAALPRGGGAHTTRNLREAELWDEAPVLELLMQLQAAARQHPGGALPPGEKQRAKHLVALLLLSQTAACLLHYGIRVAHLFLQHGLQQLPAVSQACSDAAAALAAAYDALQLQRPDAAGSTSPPAVQDHPKLHRLGEVVASLQQSGGARPGGKLRVLVVSEAKAFFCLYHALSAAGVTAVQLDGDKQLPGQHANSSAPTAPPPSPGAAARWRAAVAASLDSAACVLATPEQLCHPAMPLQAFDALVECAAAAAPPDGSAAGAGASTSSANLRLGPGRHVVLMTALPQDTHPARAGAPAAEPVPPPPPHVASQPPPAAEGTGAAGAGMPLLLNRSASSLVRRRPALYEALLQLEGQGFVLVERVLGSSGPAAGAGAAGGGRAAGGEAAGTAAAAVDVVASPRACICVWDAGKTPQDAEAASQLMCRSLLALALAYDSVGYVLELPDSLAASIANTSVHMQGLAKALGMRLQLLCSFSPESTKDAVVSLCRAAAHSFWQPGAHELQQPANMSDRPSAAEAGLLACGALNPLSAAVLACHGFELRSLLELGLTGDAASHPVLAACLPQRSIELLQVQARAMAARVQEQQAREQEALRQRQQQEQELLLRQCAEEDEEEQQQYGMAAGGGHQLLLPGHWAGGALDAAMGPEEAAALQQQQQQQQQQPQQQPQHMHDAAGGRWLAPGAHQAYGGGGGVGRVQTRPLAHHQQQQQQHWMPHEDTPQLGIDPSSVLDDFLSSRGGPAFGGSAGAARPPPAARARQPYHHHHQQQQQQATVRAAPGSRWQQAVPVPQDDEEPWMVAQPTAGRQMAAEPSPRFDAYGMLQQQADPRLMYERPQHAGHTSTAVAWALDEDADFLYPPQPSSAGAAWAAGGRGGQQAFGRRSAPAAATAAAALGAPQEPYGYGWPADDGVQDGQAPWQQDAYGRQQQQELVQSAPWQQPPRRTTTSRHQPVGGMFACGAQPAGPDSSSWGDDEGLFDYASLLPAMAPAHHGSTGHRQAAFGLPRQPQQARPAAAAATPAASDDQSRLTAPSFMAHRRPDKQLRFARPAAFKKVGRRGGRAAGGLLQTKLTWG